MYFLRYCLLLTIFTLFFYILTISKNVEGFNQIEKINKNNILNLKGKLFRNYILANKVCKDSLSPSPSLSPIESLSPASTNKNCNYDKELNTINPCVNNHCKTFKEKGNIYHLSYENRPLEKISPFSNKHFGDTIHKKIHNVSIKDEKKIQEGEDIIIPSKIGDKDISELGHCLDNCCNQIIGSKSGNVWNRKRSIFDKKICKETYKRKIKPEVNLDIFNYLTAGGNTNGNVFQYKPKNCDVTTY